MFFLFLVTGDIAQQPRIRLQYQKIFGQEKNWWWRSEAYAQRLTQDVLYNVKKQTISNSMPFILKTKSIETSIL